MHDGILGSIKGLKNGDPLKWIIRIVACAAVLLIAKKAGVPQFGWEAVAIMFLLGIAALGAEYYLAKEVTSCFYERAVSPMLMFAVLWAGAFLYGLNQWAGAASEGQAEKSNLHKSAFVASQNAHKDRTQADAAMIAQRAVVARIQGERWRPLPTVDGNPIGSAAEASKIIDGQRAKTRMWELTEGCTKSAGKQTVAFVKTCTEAKAAIAAAQTRDELAPALASAEASLATLEAKFEAASARADSTAVMGSEQRNDLLLLTRWGGMSETTAQDVNALGSIVFISLIMTGLGVLSERKEHQNRDIKPWPWMVAIKRAMFGKASVGGEIAPPQPHVSEIGNRTSEPRAYPHFAGIPAEPVHVHTIERITDKALKRWSASDEVRAMLNGHGQLKAA